ncbi:prephenate dehydratase [Sediminibacterium ginsengisoli]|uniref:prephenate dehydratase n=1 Tax=Sediminibacterium ginsengisoli TaxID=413434 RepID=A0A1T4QTS4_9BACT|nr:prephenate dehydratase [Sediminibacterium ginsengisoli]SKA07017.1 prephenate dehydratase [Sediminibacterium ginsengisoli]
MNNSIAIQGYEGSFHQVAARHFFGKDVEVLPCATFREVIRTAEDKKLSGGGIMAIENSIAGSILPNYNLIQKAKLKVTGEVFLSISQNLLVNPGVRLEDIREVHSHPMALLQCIDFLEQHNWKLVETEDTALSARHIHKHRSNHVAAVAGKLAAELFDLEILAPDIHTLKNNVTRFLVLQREKDAVEPEDADKASLYFQTDHSKGSLAKVLGKIADNGLNLSKLQSMPIPGSNFKYGFYADMEFDNRKQLDKVLTAINALTIQVKMFGIYKTGKAVKG